MVKKVIVGLDGSPLAEAALPYAEIFARANRASVVLVQAVPIDEMPEEPPEEESPRADSRATGRTPESTRDLTTEQRAVYRAERYLHAVAERMGGAGVVAESVVAVGAPATILVEEAQTRQAELLILSTHGRSGLGRWIYGSVADEVMRRSSVPVLLVPPACHLIWSRDGPRRIFVPLDGSDLAAEALAPAEHLTEALGATLVLGRVVEPPLLAYAYTYPGVTPAVLSQAEDEETHARRYLEGIAAPLGERGRSATTHVASGPAIPTILDVVEEESVHLIVMATHGNGGVTRLLMGSVATGLVQRARVPIVIVRPASVRKHDAIDAASVGR